MQTDLEPCAFTRYRLPENQSAEYIFKWSLNLWKSFFEMYAHREIFIYLCIFML